MKSLHFSSYDRPWLRSYHFSQVDFGAGANIAILIPVPRFPAGTPSNVLGGTGGAGRGFGGRVLSAEILRITEDFAGATTDAGVRVGDGTTVGKYFDSNLILDETVDVGEAVYLVDNGSQVDIEDGRNTITLTAVVSTGTPTGTADLILNVAWWQGRTI
jgi:hypothetical protein